MKGLKKLKNSLSKKGISTQFVDPDHWISFPAYALNHKVTGTFTKGIPNRRSTLFWGPKGSGKTFLLALAAKAAQDDGYHVVYIDTETAAETDYMEKVGIDLAEDKFTPITIASIEEGFETMSQIFQYAEPEDKIFVAFDSLSMMLSEKEMKDFEKGDMKGDQGQMAKKLKLFMKNVNSKISKFNMYFAATGHAYANQDLTNGKGTHIFSGGEGVEFIPSIALFVNRMKLKGDDSEIDGIRIKVEVNKTRFTKPYGKLELSVPYDTGIDPLDGLLEIAEKTGIVNKNGGWYSYERDGETVKFQKSTFEDHFTNLFDFSEKGVEEKTEDEVQKEKEE